MKERKKRYFYKVVRDRNLSLYHDSDAEFGSDAHFVSCIVHGDAAVEYKVGKWVKAPKFYADCGYHLLVFNTLESAQRFWQGNKDQVIFEVEARGRIRIPPVPVDWSIVGYIHDWTRSPRGCWPKGTEMVKSVKLVRRIENDQSV